MGMGFIVSRQGHVLTNYHVVKGCTAIRAATEGGKQSLTVVGTDAENDLVGLQLPTHVQHTARFREGRTIRSGDGVIVIGFPLRGLLASEANNNYRNGKRVSGHWQGYTLSPNHSSRATWQQRRPTPGLCWADRGRGRG